MTKKGEEHLTENKFNHKSIQVAVHLTQNHPELINSCHIFIVSVCDKWNVMLEICCKVLRK